MDLTLVLLLSLGMVATGLVFIYVLLRHNTRPWPQDAVQWAGVGLSSLLVVAAAFLLVLVLSFSREGRTPSTWTGQPPRDAALGAQAENFTFRLVNNDAPSALADYRGSVVLLNFWATWCPPCLEEMPELNRLQETYRDVGLVVLTVSDEPRQALLDFEELLPLQTVSAYLTEPERLPQPFIRMLEGRPMTFVIDRQGVVRDIMVGSRTFDLFAQAIAPYLEQDVAVR